MHTLLFLAMISGIAVTAGILLSVYFLFIRNENRTELGLLAGIFTAISLRVGKSVFYYMTVIPDFGVALGFMGLASVGPFTWLYLREVSSKESSLKKSDWIHFIFPVAGFIPVWLMGNQIQVVLYQTATGILFIYSMMSWAYFFRMREQSNSISVWNVMVLSSVTLIWGAFVIQIFTDTILMYAWGAALAAFCLYVLMIYALKKPVLLPKGLREKTDPRVILKLKRAIEEQQVYIKSALTLAELSEELGEPAYIVSKAINAEYGKTFPELMNYYRIEEVKSKLINSDEKQVKIEGLAYEAGFNTPSAFYAAFKKETSLSPGEFRRQALSE